MQYVSKPEWLVNLHCNMWNYMWSRTYYYTSISSARWNILRSPRWTVYSSEFTSHLQAKSAARTPRLCAIKFTAIYWVNPAFGLLYCCIKHDFIHYCALTILEQINVFLFFNLKISFYPNFISIDSLNPQNIRKIILIQGKAHEHTDS